MFCVYLLCVCVCLSMCAVRVCMQDAGFERKSAPIWPGHRHLPYWRQSVFVLFECVCVSSRKVIVYPPLFYCQTPLQLFPSNSLRPVTETKLDSIPSYWSLQLLNIQMQTANQQFLSWEESSELHHTCNIFFLYILCEQYGALCSSIKGTADCNTCYVTAVFCKL